MPTLSRASIIPVYLKHDSRDSAGGHFAVQLLDFWRRTDAGSDGHRPGQRHQRDSPNSHTPGSISLWIPSENKVNAGDTLFRDSIGRTDLPGGDGRQILKSIRDKLLQLSEDAVVVPGHGPNTTIGREKERNPFLHGLS